MSVIGNETITILNAPLVKDQYNNMVRDWPSAVPTVVRRVTVDPQSSSESRVANDQTVTTVRASMPVSAPLDAFSRVLWAATTWEVDGRPVPFYGGPLAHREVTLKEVAG